jgi:hypothetical protein
MPMIGYVLGLDKDNYQVMDKSLDFNHSFMCINHVRELKILGPSVHLDITILGMG